MLFKFIECCIFTWGTKNKTIWEVDILCDFLKWRGNEQVKVFRRANFRIGRKI